jgi:magnesium-transporting ATPase (P-type)
MEVDGDPMEGALVALAMKAGLNPDHLRAEWKRLDEIPFDAAYRFMATLHAGPAADHVIFLKGAPEEVMVIAGSIRETGNSGSRRRPTMANGCSASP